MSTKRKRTPLVIGSGRQEAGGPNECDERNDSPVVYHGAEHVGGRLPRSVEPWPKFGGRRTARMVDHYDISREELVEHLQDRPFVWPRRRLLFFCDIHADADAFVRSLVASGGVAKTGPGDTDFVLTDEGQRSRFIIGGDCFDKGPNNLRLLDALRALKDKGADVDILAGNHDVRTLVGLACAGRKEPHLAHLFVRMGKKTMPLFKEVHERYCEPGETSGRSEKELHDLLFPPESWFEEFPKVASEWVNPIKMKKELRRIREKIADIDRACGKLGMTLGMVHAALEKCREIFLEPGGDYHWFFHEMKLCRRYGSLLFVHAGVDDVVADLLLREGEDGLNRRFKELMDTDLFVLYHGSIGNAFRTKYRDIDKPFTAAGVEKVHAAGIYAIVHGHRNILRGQRIKLRGGLLNFECDASVDANTRALEGLHGPGGAALIVRPDGSFLGVSTDYRHIKHFEITSASRMVTLV